MPPKQQQQKAPAAASPAPGPSGQPAQNQPRFSLLSSDSAESLEPLLLLPPDGGYGWVVVATCFLMNLFADGSIYSFGYYQASVQHEFKKGAAEVALLPSLCSGFYYMAGPVWGAIGNRWGFRVVSTFGALSSAGALTACYFIDDFGLFILAYGVLLGISSGAVYISTTIVVGFYFERWRGVATSLTSCGSGVGVMVMPLCYRALEKVEGYTWRWALLLNSSLMAATAALALLLRPLRPVAMTRGERTVRFQDDGGAAAGKARKGLRLLRQRGRESKSPAAGLVPDHPESDLILVAFGMLQLYFPFVTSFLRDNEARDALAGTRPMYRDDIFYRASASRLSSQLSRITALSVPRPATLEDAEPHGRCCPRCPRCPNAVLRALGALLDCSLLANTVFMVFAMAQVFIMLGYFTPYIFMQGQAEAAGVPLKYAEWMLPVLGMSNALGRALAGVLCEVPGVSAVTLSCGSLTLASLVVAATCYSADPAYQIFIASAYGLLVAPFMAMKSLVLVDFLGIERLTNSFGLLLMFQGATVMMGPPLSGWIRDETNSYTYVFIISGAFLFVAANLPYLMFPLSIYEKKKEMNRELQIRET